MKANLGAGPPGWACKANLQLLWGGHGEWTSPSSGLGMLFGLKGWLTCSRGFSVCVHVPKAAAGPVTWQQRWTHEGWDSITEGALHKPSHAPLVPGGQARSDTIGWRRFAEEVGGG